jgi:prepilin-type N-terminal cleavage/methylation domain-containing protein
MTPRRRRQRGVTLLEVLIAVTLLALLTGGMMTLMHVGFSAYGKTSAKLMENRRVAGAQRIIEQQLQGFMPTIALCGPPGPGPAKTAVTFFQGEPASMRLVSNFSLQQAWRGRPQILEFTVIPGENGRGVRLVVNELPYNPDLPGLLCTGSMTDPVTGLSRPRFRPVETGPASFVLADKLAGCRFSYLEGPTPPAYRERWVPVWVLQRWPSAVRIEMAPLEADHSRLQPISITVPMHITRSPGIQYVD